jgi:t-SNARE complex subunit (syntaxin)
MRQSKSELEMILNALKSKQLEVSDKIIEGLSDSGIPQEQKKLLDERKDIVSQIQNIQERIDNYTSQTPDIQTEASASTINKTENEQRYDNTMEFVEQYKSTRSRMNWIDCYAQLQQKPNVMQYKNPEVLRVMFDKFKKKRN